MVNITLEDDTLEIEFLYDGSDATLEEKVIKKHHQLRSKFGLNKSPSFNVLIHRHSTFSQEEVRTEALDVDLHKNYNDDFIEISETVSDSIKQNNSGMILLHGKPGTGKTTYIKYLISKHREHNFIFVKNEFVDKLLDPDFISFLLKQRNTILIIEDAEKVISSRESKIDNSVVSTILQLTDGLFSDYLNLKIICTFNTHLSKVDTALLRKGRLIALYEFKPLTIEKTHALLESISNDKVEEGMTISDIYNFERKGFTSIRKKIGFN